MPTTGRQPLGLAGLTVAPGERAAGWLTIGESWQRRGEAVPVALVRGHEPGPIAYVQAVSDGDELNGLRVVQRLLVSLQPEQMSGAVWRCRWPTQGPSRRGRPAILGTGANSTAASRARATGPSPSGWRTRCSTNSCWPATWSSISTRTASCRCCPKSESAPAGGGRSIPNHSPWRWLLGWPTSSINKGRRGSLPGRRRRGASRRSNPELGGNPGIDATAVELGLRGVLRVLGHAGILPERPAPGEPPFVARGLLAILSRPAAGW